MSRRPILIIDDDRDLCELMEDALDDIYAVHLCHEAHKASTLTQQHQPALIILDINLHDENGLQLCQQLQTLRSVPVLLISGDDADEFQDASQRQNNTAFLAKPFSIKKLRTAAATLIDVAKN